MTRKKVGLIIALNLFLIVLAFLWYRHTPPLSEICQGNLTFTDQRDDNIFSFEGEITLRFHPDGSGYFTLNGDVLNDEREWQVSRQETFGWQQKDNSLYEISIVKVERFGHDQLPDGVFEKYLTGVTLGQKRLLTIERTPQEAMVISNFYSPLLVCSE